VGWRETDSLCHCPCGYPRSADRAQAYALVGKVGGRQAGDPFAAEPDVGENAIAPGSRRSLARHCS